MTIDNGHDCFLGRKSCKKLEKVDRDAGRSQARTSTVPAWPMMCRTLHPVAMAAKGPAAGFSSATAVNPDFPGPTSSTGVATVGSRAATVCAQVRPSAITIDALSVPIRRLAPQSGAIRPLGQQRRNAPQQLTTPVSMTTLKFNAPLEAAPIALMTVS